MPNNRVLTLTITAIISIQLSSAATKEDAMAAFDELTFLGNTLMSDLATLKMRQEDILHQQLSDENSTSSKDIEDQLTELRTRIGEVMQNAMATDIQVGVCVENLQANIHAFQGQVQQELEECYGNMIGVGLDSIDHIWASVIYTYSSTINCQNVSLIQCDLFEDASQCYDKFLETVNTVMPTMDRRMKEIRAELLNRMLVLRMPCRDLILQELALYSKLVLDQLSACINVATSLPISQDLLCVDV